MEGNGKHWEPGTGRQGNRGAPATSSADIYNFCHKLDLLQEPPNSSQKSGGIWNNHNPVDLNPNATDIKINIPGADDKFTDLFGAVLIITLSVVNANGSDLDTNIDNVTVHQANHGDMLFRAESQDKQHSNRVY